MWLQRVLVKIAIVRKRYTFHGGAEGFSQGLVSRLAAAGHEVHLYAISWEGMAKTERITIHKVPAFTFNSVLRDLSFAVSVRRLLKAERFDVIQSNDKTLYQDIYRAGDGCHREWLGQRWRRTGIPGRLSMLLNPYHWLILWLEGLILRGRRYRKILAISEMVKRNIIEHYGVPASDITVIYNGVDLERFHPGNRERFRDPVRRHYGLSGSDFVILFVGSGFERKGVRYLLEAVERITEPVTLLIVGRGRDRALAKYKGRQRVVFCGPRKEVEQFYAAADLFVMPTIYEPFGNVHLEALASGLPVITTRNSGAAEVIEEGIQGSVINEPEDAHELSERIRKYLDPQECARAARNARLLAERFSFDRYIGEVTALYETILEGKRQNRTAF